MSNKARQTRKEIIKAMSNLDSYIAKDEAIADAIKTHYDDWIDSVVDVLGVERDSFIQTLTRDGIWPRVSRFIYEQNLTDPAFGVKENTLIDSFISKRGWRESSSAKHYLNALNKSSYGLWEVVDLSDHRVLGVRALASSDEPMSIVDGHSGLLAVAGDCICGRLLSLGSKHYFAEGKLVMPRAHVPALEQSIADSNSIDEQSKTGSLQRLFFRHWAVVSYNKAVADQSYSG